MGTLLINIHQLLSLSHHSLPTRLGTAQIMSLEKTYSLLLLIMDHSFSTWETWVKSTLLHLLYVKTGFTKILSYSSQWLWLNPTLRKQLAKSYMQKNRKELKSTQKKDVDWAQFYRVLVSIRLCGRARIPRYQVCEEIWFVRVYG